MRTIGAADEFWRLRLSRLDTTEDLDFEWREDILYREPIQSAEDELVIFQVEAVRLNDKDEVSCLARFYDREEASEYLATARDDLASMTKNQFEDAYLAGDDDLPLP
jgi:hypothetical protein